MRTAALVVICAALAAMNGLSAQTPPAFEVASIRRNTSGIQQGGGLVAPQPGGRFIAVGATLRRLVSGAYDDLQIIGGPAWIDSDRFDINARAEGEPGPTQMRAMLRSLLADRFKLVAHTESRDLPRVVTSGWGHAHWSRVAHRPRGRVRSRTRVVERSGIAAGAAWSRGRD